MRLLSLPAALARFGLTVEVVPGWETAGSDAFNPGCTVGHHTAGSSRGVRPSLRICVEGRPDLPGPLCNTYTDRNGVAIVVASGRANHAGRGGFRGLIGNSSAIGHEAEDEGDGRWTDAQLWAFPRVHAAHLWLLGRDASWYCSHRTWTPRKPDPAGLADVDMQRHIHALITAPPRPAPTAPEDDMARLISEDGIKQAATDGVRVWPVPNMDMRNALAKSGLYGPLDAAGNPKVWPVPPGTITSMQEAAK